MPTLRTLALLLCACSTPRAVPAAREPVEAPTADRAPEVPSEPTASETPTATATVPAATLDVVKDLDGALDTSSLEMPGSFPPLRDIFVPVGFSPDGHFAWYTEHADEAVGGYLWSFTIVDLETDKVLGEVHWQHEEIETVNTRADVLATHGDAMRALMKTHGILGTPSARVPLPATVSGHAFDVRYDRTRPSGDNDGYVESSATVHLLRDGHAKRLGVVQWVDMAGCCDVQPPILVTSPYEERGALIVPAWQRGWEGPPHVLQFSVLGAHLETRFPAE